MVVITRTADAVSFVVSLITEAGERATRSVDVSTHVTGRAARIQRQFRHWKNNNNN